MSRAKLKFLYFQSEQELNSYSEKFKNEVASKDKLLDKISSITTNIVLESYNYLHDKVENGITSINPQELFDIISNIVIIRDNVADEYNDSLERIRNLRYEIEILQKKYQALQFLVKNEFLYQDGTFAQLIEEIPSLGSASSDEVKSANARLLKFIQQHKGEIPDHLAEYIAVWTDAANKR